MIVNTQRAVAAAGGMSPPVLSRMIGQDVARAQTQRLLPGLRLVEVDGQQVRRFAAALALEDSIVVYRRRQYARLAVMVPLCYGWLVVVVAVLLGMGVETKDLVDVVPSLLIPVVFMSVAFFAFRNLMVSVNAGPVTGW